MEKIARNKAYSAFSQLYDLEPMSYYKEEYLHTGLSLFCISISQFYLSAGLHRNDDYNKWRDGWKYTCKLLEEGNVSKYQISRLKNITKILCEARELHETEILSDAEFLTTIQTVKAALMQKFGAVKKAYLKNKVAQKELDKKNLQELRAKIATLQNEN